jgi:hypothetical protein
MSDAEEPTACARCERSLQLNENRERPDDDIPIMCWRCQHELIGESLQLLREIGVHGEKLWDSDNFRGGYKKIGSGLLVDCRNLLRKHGIDPDTALSSSQRSE